jgi:hypothetical protein
MKLKEVLKEYFLPCAGVAHLFMSAVVFTATLVPHWIGDASSASKSMGLFETCTGPGCRKNAFPAQLYYAQPGLLCQRSGMNFQDRLRAGGALVIGSTILHALALCVMVPGLARGFRSETAWIFVTALTGLAAVGQFIGLVLVTVTLNHWRYCGVSFCTAASSAKESTTCGWGFSFASSLVTVILGFALTAILIASCLQPPSSAASSKLRFAGFILLWVLIVLGVLAAATPHWVYWDTSRYSMGLFRSCIDTECHDNLWDISFESRPGCTVSGSNLHAGMNTTAALLFSASIIFLALAVYYGFRPLLKTRTGLLNVAVICLTAFCGALVVMALIVFGHTMNSYLYCGQEYCEGKPLCGYGLSFALALLVPIAAASMVLLQVWEHHDFVGCFAKQTQARPDTETSNCREPITP